MKRASLTPNFRNIFCLAIALLLPVANTQAHSLAAPEIRACELKALRKIPIAMVGGYSSGSDVPAAIERLKNLGPEFNAETGNAAARVELHHIHPELELPPALAGSFRPGDYITDRYFRNTQSDFDAIVADLRARGVITVLAGTESSVALADRLNAALGLAGNSVVLSAARRNKFLMQEAVQRAGIPGIPSRRTGNVDEALSWIRNGFGNTNLFDPFPVVVKPLDSAGTQGVTICRNEAEVRQAFQNLLGTQNMFNGTISEVIVQPFITGPEFVVNSIGSGRNADGRGRHLTGEVWAYTKRDVEAGDGTVARVYDNDRLLLPSDPEVEILVPYAHRVLDALGIFYGPSHMEIILSPRGPILVEVGARLMGGHTEIGTRAALGHAPIDLWMMSILAPVAYQRIQAQGYMRASQHVRKLDLISHRTGRVLRINHEAELRSLPGIVEFFLPRVGETIERTTNLLNSPGGAWIRHADPRVVQATYDRIRELEPTMFEVEAP